MKSKRVLIVDDNDLNRKLFENLIGQFWQFRSANNGLEAVEILQQEIFDLVLMDIQMPKMDGITALKKIRSSKLTACPVIAITAYADESDRNHFLDMGFADFISKPIRPKEFLEKLTSQFKKEELTVETDELDDDTVPNVILEKRIIRQLMKYNSKEAIIKVLEGFVEEMDEVLADCSKALEMKSIEVLTEKLHILKGNSGTLGANIIYLLSQEAEAEAKNGDFAKLEQTLQSLKNERDTFTSYLKEQPIFDI